jgi:hypothetical protein
VSAVNQNLSGMGHIRLDKTDGHSPVPVEKHRRGKVQVPLHGYHGEIGSPRPFGIQSENLLRSKLGRCKSLATSPVILQDKRTCRGPIFQFRGPHLDLQNSDLDRLCDRIKSPCLQRTWQETDLCRCKSVGGHIDYSTGGTLRKSLEKAHPPLGGNFCL